MVTLKIAVMVGEDRRLIINLPDNMPVGPAELTIQPTEFSDLSARGILMNAGALVTDFVIPDDIEYVSDEELEEIGQMPPGTRPSEALIDEDRGAY
jgi:hypothetical protein